jgi:hypothetical protein
MPREEEVAITSQVPEQDGLDGLRPDAPPQVIWDVMLAGYRVPTGWHQHPDRVPERRLGDSKRRDERCGTSGGRSRATQCGLEWLLSRRGTVRPAGLDLPAEIAHRNARSDQPHPSPRDESEQVLTGLVHVVNR